MITRNLISICACAAIAASTFADTQVSEYKTNTGGNWTTSSTWNMLNPANSYPKDNTMAFCIEGTGKTLTLNENITVGRMIGGGGHFDDSVVKGSGSLTFDVLYDSTNNYAYAASALWGHGSITYENTGGVAYTTTEVDSAFDPKVGIKIFNTKAGSDVVQTITYNTSFFTNVATSMYGKKSSVSTVNFNAETRLTDYFINSGTSNFNGTTQFENINAKSGGVANFNGKITGGNIIAAGGTLNFTGDYTASGVTANVSTVTSTGTAVINYNHKGVITTGYQYYENNGNVTISKDSTVAINPSAAAGNSWGTLFLFQTGGTSLFTVNGKIDASNYAGADYAQFIRNWGSLVLNSTAEIVATGKISSIMYMGRASKFTINGNAVITGNIKRVELWQQKTSGATLTLNNSKTLANMAVYSNKDVSGGDGTTADTLTNSLITLSGDTAIGSFGFASANNQFTIDLADCTSLVMHTLFDDTNKNIYAKGGKLIFKNFKNGVVYIENITNINLDTFNDYVTTDVDGVTLTIKDNFIYSAAIPEPATIAAILGALALGLAIVRRSKKN